MAEVFALVSHEFTGIYIARRDGQIVIETRMASGEWLRVAYTKDLFTNDVKDILTSFFILNRKRLAQDFVQRKIHSVNGIFIERESAGDGYNCLLNITIAAGDSERWYNMDMFNTDMNNHVSYFILQL